MATRIQVRRDTATNWTSTDPTLASGEIGLVTDSGKVVGCKVGTGSVAWTALEYAFPVMQTGANVNTAGDNTDVTFLLKGLTGQSVAVFGIEETGTTDKVLEINKDGDIIIRKASDNSTQLTFAAATGNTDIVNGTLAVGGAVDFDSTLNVDGAVTMQDDVTINADNKMFRIQNNSAADKFTVDTDTGATVIAGDVTANGNITGDDACTLYAPADLAKGTSSSNIHTGGGGSVVQMKFIQINEGLNGTDYSQANMYWSAAAGAKTNVSPFDISITPKSAHSVIEISLSLNGGMSYTTQITWHLEREVSGESTVILTSQNVSSRHAGAFSPRISLTYNASTAMSSVEGTYYDVPNTTSAVTYKLYFSAESGGSSGTVLINKTYGDGDTADKERCCSSICVKEYAAKDN